MTGTLLWVRRTWWVGVLIAAVYAIALMRSLAWKWDWAWMLSILSGATLLPSPALAGVATVVMLRLFPADAREVTSVSAKPWAPALQIAIAVWLQALAAYIVAGAIAATVCALYQADRKGVLLPWTVLVGPAALLAASALGVLLGLVTRSGWSVPLVVLGLFIGHRPTYWTNLPELFTLKQATGSAANAGYRPVVGHLLATLAVNVLTAAGLIALSFYFSAPRGLRQKRLVAIAFALMMVVAIIFGWGWPASYEPIPL
jgi:hypothetical protein